MQEKNPVKIQKFARILCLFKPQKAIMDISFVQRQKMAKIRAFDLSCVVIPPPQRSLSQDGLSVFGLQIFFFLLEPLTLQMGPWEGKNTSQISAQKAALRCFTHSASGPSLVRSCDIYANCWGKKSDLCFIHLCISNIPTTHCSSVSACDLLVLILCFV